MLVYPILKHKCLRLVSVELSCCISRLYLPCVSYFIDICSVIITNIGNIHATLTNQITDILHFNDNVLYRSLSDTLNISVIITLSSYKCFIYMFCDNINNHDKKWVLNDYIKNIFLLFYQYKILKSTKVSSYLILLNKNFNLTKISKTANW